MTPGSTAGIRFGSRPRQDNETFPFADPRAGLARLRDLPWAPAQRLELEALGRETDPEIFYRDLMNFGRRLEESQPELAAEVYALFVGESSAGAAVPPLTGEGLEAPLRIAAQAARDALLGRGAAGPRAELLLRRLTREALEPSTLFAMGAAGAVYRMTRLAALRGLLHLPAGLLTRGAGVRGSAALAGFALEAPAFTLSAKLGGAALGRVQDWSGEALGRETASSYLVLGGLKLAGWASAAGYRKIAAPLGAEAVPPLRTLFQQGGMLTGILLGHSLEERLGLRQRLDGATTLVDSLALLLQFHAAGTLSRRALGTSFDRWQRRLDLHAAQAGCLAPPRESRLAWALPLEPQVRARDHYILMEGENGGRPSPPIVRGQRGSDPPPDLGAIGRDATHWGAAQGRNPEAVRLVALLTARLRVELWNALNLRIEGHVAAAIARRRELLVRILPIDGSLENYSVELHPKGRLGPQSDPSEVRFLLNTADGSLRLQDFLPNAVWELRRQQAGLPPVAGFLPFYRSIQGFASEGLKAEPLLATLPAAAKEYISMEPTREWKRAPSPVPPDPAPASPAPAAPKPAFTGPTLLVAYFPRIMAGVRESVDRYLDEMMIRGEKERKRLHGLAQHILLTLHQREVEDPEIGTVSNLQIWIRPSPQGQGRRSVEVLSPMEALLKNQEQPYGPEDILLILSRNPGYLGTEMPTLEHQYLRHNRKNPRIPAGEDLEFQRDLGLGDQLRFRMTVHDLSLRPPDLASWQRWMEEHVRGAKPPDLP